MSFRFNTPSTAAASSSVTSQEQWKAQAFLNLWIRKSDGTRTKVGAIPLKETRNFDRALISRLQQDGALEAMMNSLELDFQMADKPVGSVDVGF